MKAVALAISQECLVNQNASSSGSTRPFWCDAGVIVNHPRHLGFNQAVPARDPDGHAVEIEEG